MREYVAFAKAEHGDMSVAREVFSGLDKLHNSTGAVSSFCFRSNLSYFLLKTGQTTAALAESQLAMVGPSKMLSIERIFEFYLYDNILLDLG